MAKSVSLSVGRGEKQSVKAGAGLTAKGRAKYNRATGSNLTRDQCGNRVKRGAGDLLVGPHLFSKGGDKLRLGHRF